MYITGFSLPIAIVANSDKMLNLERKETIEIVKMRKLIYFSWVQTTISFMLLNDSWRLSDPIVPYYLHQSISSQDLLHLDGFQVYKFHWNQSPFAPTPENLPLSSQHKKSIFFKSFLALLFYLIVAINNKSSKSSPQMKSILPILWRPALALSPQSFFIVKTVLFDFFSSL